MKTIGWYENWIAKHDSDEEAIINEIVKQDAELYSLKQNSPSHRRRKFLANSYCRNALFRERITAPYKGGPFSLSTNLAQASHYIWKIHAENKEYYNRMITTGNTSK